MMRHKSLLFASSLMAMFFVAAALSKDVGLHAAHDNPINVTAYQEQFQAHLFHPNATASKEGLPIGHYPNATGAAADDNDQMAADDLDTTELNNFLKEIGTTMDKNLEAGFEPMKKHFDDWMTKLEAHFSNVYNMLMCLVVFSLAGVICLCVVAPCIFIYSSCSETCGHCCGGSREIRELKQSDRYKYFDERLTYLEQVNGIKTKVEIPSQNDSDNGNVEKKSAETKETKDSKSGEPDNKKKKKKGKKDTKDTKDVTKEKKTTEQSVGASVDQNETKSQQQ